jgi:hypothetical protein
MECCTVLKKYANIEIISGLIFVSTEFAKCIISRGRLDQVNLILSKKVV